MRTTNLNRLLPFGWPVFEHLDTLRDEINRIFAGPELSRRLEFFNHWAPALDVYENNNAIVVQAELPGFRKEDIEVSLHEGNLTISGERKIERAHDQVEVTRSERPQGRFQRTVRLPKPVDAGNVNAAYRDGILTVTLAKTEEAKPRQIKIKSN